MSSVSTSFLYAASAFDLVKVGTSRDPERRARLIYGQLLHKVEVPANKAADAEAYAHSLLNAHEESSEWFSCSADMAIEALTKTGARVAANLSLDTPNRPGLANSKRGLIKASQRRADRTEAALRIALTMWFDPYLTVKQISERCGLSRHTLYDHLPPRFGGRENDV